jgi:hypothetical protein
VHAAKYTLSIHQIFQLASTYLLISNTQRPVPKSARKLDGISVCGLRFDAVSAPPLLALTLPLLRCPLAATLLRRWPLARRSPLPLLVARADVTPSTAMRASSERQFCESEQANKETKRLVLCLCCQVRY